MRRGFGLRVPGTTPADAGIAERHSTMTESEQDPLGRAQKLHDLVDGLDEKVAGEREAQGVPGRPSDREQTVARGCKDEPPD